MRAPKRWPHAKSGTHAALCDALHGVLEALRAGGEAAAPFLARVSKADAPGYADIVTYALCALFALIGAC